MAIADGEIPVTHRVIIAIMVMTDGVILVVHQATIVIMVDGARTITRITTTVAATMEAIGA